MLGKIAEPLPLPLPVGSPDSQMLLHQNYTESWHLETCLTSLRCFCQAHIFLEERMDRELSEDNQVRHLLSAIAAHCNRKRS